MPVACSLHACWASWTTAGAVSIFWRPRWRWPTKVSIFSAAPNAWGPHQHAALSPRKARRADWPRPGVGGWALPAPGRGAPVPDGSVERQESLDQVRAVRDAELAQQARLVDVDGPEADAEGLADLLAGLAFDQQRGDVALARCHRAAHGG